MSDAVAVRLLDIRESPLSVDECLAAVTSPGAGGVVVFTGVVRDHDGGRRVVALDYSAHPTAADALRDVAAAVAERHVGVALAAVHRVGPLEVGDIAVVVAAAAAHREAAFAAARELIDDLKAGVPIWKRQTYDDGAASWVGCDQP